MKRYDIECSGFRVHEAPDGDWVQYEDVARLQKQLAAAEDELRRLGHGSEVIDVITENGVRFTSYVGDISWDTAGNRARVREAHAAAQAAAKASHAELEALRARVTRAVAVLATPGTWSEFARAALKELRGG